MVGRRDGCHGGVRSTVKVVRVIMASDGTPTGMPIAVVLENLFLVGTC